MRVDVVTAVHGAYAHFLAAAWQSLCAQTHRDWRWLIQIDGPARAVTPDLIACGAADDPRVGLAVNGVRSGPAVTRNVALGRASARLVQNLDADDELEPDALETLAGALATEPAAGFAAGVARDLLSSGDLVDLPLPVGPGLLPRGALVEAWVTDDGEYRLPVHPAGVMWRREVLLTAGGWAGLHGMEDTGLLMSASALSPCVVVDAVTLRYRRHRAQRSKQSSNFEGGGGTNFADSPARSGVTRGAGLAGHRIRGAGPIADSRGSPAPGRRATPDLTALPPGDRNRWRTETRSGTRHPVAGTHLRPAPGRSVCTGREPQKSQSSSSVFTALPIT